MSQIDPITGFQHSQSASEILIRAKELPGCLKLNDLEVNEFDEITMGVHGMTKLQTTVVRPEKPREPVRRVGIIRLGKILALGLLLTSTTAAIGFVGETVSAALAHSETQVRAESIGLVELTANQTAVEANSVEPLTKSGMGTVLGAGAVLFWLGLAAANLRRQGVKDYRSDNRIGSALTSQAMPPSAVRS